MIAPMKKAAVIAPLSHRRRVLVRLRRLGLVHVADLPQAAPEAQEWRERKSLLEKALVLCGSPSRPGDVKPLGQDDLQSALQLAESIINRHDQLKAAREETAVLRLEQAKLDEWSGVSLAELEELRSAGVAVKILELPREKITELPAGACYFAVKRTKSVLRLAAFLFNEKDLEVFPELSPPARGNAELERILADNTLKQEKLENELQALAENQETLLAALTEAERRIEFASVAAALGELDELCFLTGFLPADKAGELQSAGRENGWGLLIREPEPGDEVPTEVRNPGWIEIIRPVFQLLGTVPGYREYDISFLFLFFLTFFFAMIIGDAGYGGVMLVGTLFFARRCRNQDRPPAITLMLLMSAATVVWGAVTGTWFGSATLAELPVLTWFVVPAIATFNPASSETIKYICFITGTLHISIAHLWKFYRQSREKPFIRSLAQLGWLFLVLGLFYLVLSLVLDAEKYPLPAHATFLMATGLSLVILFSQQQGRFLHGVAMGFANLLTTFLNGIGAFSDIISYIRLFAVGLATVEIAKSFNEMAAAFAGNLTGIIAASLVLLLGHSLNLAMGALSVVVHGVRLNMLEFSGHLGMEWTGKPYKPFKE